MPKKILFTLAAVILLSANIFGQIVTNEIWTNTNARIIPYKQVRLSTLFFSKYAPGKNIELQAKPLWWIKIPNFNLKIRWINIPEKQNKKFYKRIGFDFATLHGIYYPAPLLNYWAARNFRPVNLNINPIAKTPVIRNEAIFSIIDIRRKGCGMKHTYYTAKLGFAMPLTKNNTVISTQNAYLFRKTAPLKDLIWYLGIYYDNDFAYGLKYSLGLTFYSVKPNVENFVLEHNGFFYMLWLTHLRVGAGYKIAFTNKLNVKPAIYPAFDFTLIFFAKKHKKKKQKQYLKPDFKDKNENQDKKDKKGKNKKEKQ